MFSRRQLLAGLAAIVAASSAGALTPNAMTAREAFYVAEHEWASLAMLDTEASGNYTRWMEGAAEQQPDRWRLAARFLELQELAQRSPLEDELASKFAELWEAAQPLRHAPMAFAELLLGNRDAVRSDHLAWT